MGTPARLERYRALTAPFAVPVAVAATALVGSYEEAHPSPRMHGLFQDHRLPHTPALAFLLPAVAGLALAGRQKRPVATLAAATAAVIVYAGLGYVDGAALLAPAAAIYYLASEVPPRRALIIAGAAILTLTAVSAARSPLGPTGGGIFVGAFALAGALLAGIARFNRRAYMASLETYFEEQARNSAREERLRIARELHDSLAHAMATINVHAGVADHLAASNTPAVQDSLRAIKQVSKEGLNDLRAILGVLRDSKELESTQPLAGVAELEALVDRAGQAGVTTSLTIDGEARPLPTATSAAVYRIVQESLTNAIRHAGPTTADVRVHYNDKSVEIEISDSGNGATKAVSRHGHGIAGMRERAAAAGGYLQAQPRPEGGFLVRASLPIEEDSRESESR